MSGDFTVYAVRSSDKLGQFGPYFNANGGTISNATTSDQVRQFEFDYVQANGATGSGVAAPLGSGAYTPTSFTGSGHVFQNFLNATIVIDRTLTSGSGPVNGEVISGISGSGTFPGSFSDFGITEGTATTFYGSDPGSFDSVTISRSIAAVPEPSAFGLSLLALGAVGLRRRRAANK